MDCGPACIASISGYYRSSIPVSRIRQLAGTDMKGTSAFGLITAMESLGMKAKGVKCSMEGLKSAPVPSIAHIVTDQKLQHYVVVYKVSAKSIRVMDPATGEIHTNSLKKFQQEWSGVLILTAPGEEFQEFSSKISNRQRFLYLLKPHRNILFQAVLGAIIYTLLGFSTSIYIQKLTDYILVFQLRQVLHISGIAMALIIIFQLILVIVKNHMILKTGQLIDARLILGYYKHLLHLPQKFFETMRVGEILSRINDAGKIRHFLSDTAITVVLNTLILIFSAIILFIFHWKLALLVVMILPAYAIVYIITNQLNRKQERKLMVKGAELESQFVESLQNMRTVKQLNMQQYMSSEVEWRFIDLLRASYKSGKNQIFSSSSSEFISRSFTLLLLWSGAILIFRQELSLGQLMSFYAILGYLSGPAASLIGINKIIQNASIAADRLFEIMDLEYKVEHGEIEFDKDLKKDIVFRDVFFSYGTRGSLFNGISMLIPSGKITAIIGESGSGKSTIANLLTRLYEIDSGIILLGHHAITNYRIDSLRKYISIVPQQTELFAGSIVQNIAPGEVDVDLERVLQICYKLGLRQFLENLPAGIGSYVGENGITLSGGERQRISVARALYRDSPVLIFDEATSALDSSSERLLMDIILEQKELGKTIILISHRMSSVMHSDKVILMDQGTITEQGDHISLMAEGGGYSKIIRQYQASISGIDK